MRVGQSGWRTVLIRWRGNGSPEVIKEIMCEILISLFLSLSSFNLASNRGQSNWWQLMVNCSNHCKKSKTGTSQMNATSLYDDLASLMFQGYLIPLTESITMTPSVHEPYKRFPLSLCNTIHQLFIILFSLRWQEFQSCKQPITDPAWEMSQCCIDNSFKTFKPRLVKDHSLSIP